MDFPQKPQGERLTFPEFADSEFHGIDVTRDLGNIRLQRCRSTVQFVFEEVRQRRLSAFNLGGKDSLFPDISVQKETRIRQKERKPVKSSECDGGRIEEFL